MTATPTKFDERDRFQLGEISGKLDGLATMVAANAVAVDRRFSELEAIDADQEHRLKSLENSRSWLVGGAAAIGAAVSGVAAFLGLR